MVESCANKITSFFICRKTIEEKDYDLYAFKILIDFIVNIIAIFIDSIVMEFVLIVVNFTNIYKYSIYAESVIIYIFIMMILGIIK